MYYQPFLKFTTAVNQLVWERYVQLFLKSWKILSGTVYKTVDNW